MVVRSSATKATIENDTWICRRDERIQLPYHELIEYTADGIPYARPEVTLLFKAKWSELPKNQADFAGRPPAARTSPPSLAQRVARARPPRPSVAGSARLNGERRSAGVQPPDWEPRWLGRKDERALVRAVERYGTPRDVAIIDTALRVGELVALELEELEVSPRKGAVIVRHGKRGRQREVPLSSEARRVIERYISKCGRHRHRGCFWDNGERSGRKPSSGWSASTLSSRS